MKPILHQIFLYIFLLSALLGFCNNTASYEDHNICTINKEEISIDIKSLKNMTYVLERDMTFYNKHRNLQDLYIHYDSDSKVKSVQIEFFDSSGSLIKKFSKKEMSDVSAVSSFSIYEDSRILYADLELDNYPYSVKISYEQQFKELTTIPIWQPQEYNNKIKYSSITIEHPVSLPIDYKAINADFQFEEKISEDIISKRWVLENLPAIEKESYMPSSSKILPYILFSPEKFIYGGHEGSFKSWEDYSNYRFNLNKNRDGLSVTQKNVVDNICADKNTNKEKISALYKYMQINTRYVSVQEGVGGWQTFDAKYVEENKYGDCKALSNFMKAMLKYAGINSNTVSIGSGNNSFPLDSDFVYPSTNHVILYIPEEDMWLECTSSYGPTNYVGRSIEDRNCILVDEKNGGLIKTPKMTESYCHRNQTITLDEKGTANCSIEFDETGSYQESNRYYINTQNRTELEEHFYEELEIKGLEIKNFKYVVDEDAPNLQRDFDIRVNKFATKSGKRFFVPVSLVEHDFYLLSAKERIHDISFRYAINEKDSIIINIPDHLEVESMPEPNYELDTPYGKYQFEIESTGSQFKITRELIISKGQYPVSEYDTIKEFMKMVRKLDNAKIVLKEKA